MKNDYPFRNDPGNEPDYYVVPNDLAKRLDNELFRGSPAYLLGYHEAITEVIEKIENAYGHPIAEMADRAGAFTRVQRVIEDLKKEYTPPSSQPDS